MRLPPSIDLVAGRKAAAFWAVVLLVVFLALAAVVNGRHLAITDSLLLAIAQTPVGRPMDVLMVLLSLLGSAEITTLVLVAMVAAAYGRRRRFTFDLLVPVLIFGVAGIAEVAGKVFIHQPGPSQALLRGPRYGIGVATAFSFPSGHMVRATFVYGLLALRIAVRSRRLRWAWFCVVLVWTIAYSRVYLANHWPTDVAGGILLGGVALGLTLALAPRASLGEEA